MTKEQELRKALNGIVVDAGYFLMDTIKQYCHLKGEQELHDERFAAGMHISYPDLLDILDRANFKPTEDWDE